MIPQPPAVLLLGHGTRIAAGVREFQSFAQKVSNALPDRQCIASFLELASPSLKAGIEELIHKGVRRITVMPIMLMAAGHVKNDIPAALKAVQTAHPEVSIVFGRDLGIHPNMLQIIKIRIQEIESAFGPDYDRKATLLLMVGRGTSDSDVNSNISKMTRLIWEFMGFGWAETCYCAVTKPLLPEALEQTHQLGYRRVIVFPYMLFMGRLIQYILDAVDAYCA
jgi:sirohydrochlorin cobaltochelatase